MTDNNVVIVAAKRTPIGNFQGSLSSLSAPQLGSVAIKAAMQQAGIANDVPCSALMGCVLPAGVGQAPARQATIGAGLPYSLGCTTINKVCGSGMKAIMLATDSIHAGNCNVIIVGGMESMSNAPYLLPKARQGYRLGHQTALDHMFYDGLEDAYEHKLMGNYAEQCAKQYGFTRQQQDEYTLRSVSRAQAAAAEGLFDAEITAVTTKAGEVILDEGPQTARPEKIPQLKPAFAADGTVTAANSSSISDGAAALIVMNEATSKEYNCTPLARIIAHSTHSQEPGLFTTAPIGAIEKLLTKTGWQLADVDLFEINEAFAVVALASIKTLGLDPNKVNVHGGACVLGHPIGASGARIVVTLLHALRSRNLKRGIAAICIGGGEATALAIEII